MRFRDKYFKNNKGFTLIELMVVVLIIGLIASGVLINVNRSRKQARDAKRISDINTVASALAGYYADKHSYPIYSNTYPQSKIDYLSMIRDLQNGGYLTACHEDSNIVMSPGCTSTDPHIVTSPDNYNYGYGYRYSTSVSGSDYQIATVLETPNGMTGIYYCNGLPQIPEGWEYRLMNGEPVPAPTTCANLGGCVGTICY